MVIRLVVQYNTIENFVFFFILMYQVLANIIFVQGTREEYYPAIFIFD